MNCFWSTVSFHNFLCQVLSCTNKLLVNRPCFAALLKAKALGAVLVSAHRLVAATGKIGSSGHFVSITAAHFFAFYSHLLQTGHTFYDIYFFLFFIKHKTKQINFVVTLLTSLQSDTLQWLPVNRQQ